ncbi:MAG: phage tail tape measure protein [Capsulimonas sp.]|uniref:phage tail tape measure protein n=1 Tax=Capsulimonas sp. TaxID=2494211 RepID=UPI003267EBD7
MSSPEVKIKVSMDTAAAIRNARQLAQVSNEATKKIAADTKVAATVTLEFARAQAANAQASVSASRASALMSRQQVELAKEARSATQATLVEKRAVEDLGKAVLAEARASESQARAVVTAVNARRLQQKAIDDETRALTRRTEAERQADQAGRSRVAAENRQHRDEGSYLRDQRRGAQDRQQGREQLAGMVTGAGATATATVTVPIVAAAGKSVEMAMDLEQALNVLQTQTSATDAQLSQMRKTARDLGGDMTLPATSSNDAAQAMVVLSQKSLSVNDSMTAARGTLQLAAAATIDAAQAAEIEGDALTAFKLKGDQATHVADMLAASQSASGTAATDAALSMQQAAAVYASANQPIEALMTSINLLGKAGIRGSDAGTSLKEMLLKLETPTAKAQQVLDKLGISIYDADGKMRPFRDLVAQFSAATSGLTQKQRDFALGTIFGSDAIRSATVIMAGGVTQYDKMEAAVTKAGAAAELAAAKNKGLKGALDGLGSELETIGEKTAAPFLRSMTELVKKAGDAIEVLDQLPQPIKDSALALAAVAAIAGPTVMGLGAIAGGVMNIRGALALMTVGAEAAAVAETTTAAAGVAAFAAGAPLVIALIAVAGFVGAIAWKWGEVRKAQDEATDSTKRFADAQKELAASGERGALMVNQGQIASVKSYWKSVLDNRKERVDNADWTARQINVTPQSYRDSVVSGKDDPLILSSGAANPALNKSNTDIQKIIDQLDSDYKTEGKRLTEMSKEGAGAANRSLMATGGDGFAKSVISHAFDTISTPKNVASCALFVSEVFKSAGAKLPGGAIASAKGLQEWAVKSGAQPHSAKDALPGDLIVWHGGRYGAPQANGKRSGYHVGFSLGDGQIRQSSKGVIKSMGMYDAAHATAYTIPGSTFAPGATPAAGPAAGAGRTMTDAELMGTKADKAAKDKATALVNAAGLDVKKAEAALDHCKTEYSRTGDPAFLILAKTALVKVRNARLKEAQAAFNKAKQEAKAQGTDGDGAAAAFKTATFDITAQYGKDDLALSDQLTGTPEERRKRAQQAALTQKRGLLYHTDTAISDHERQLGRGDDGAYSLLKDAYGKRRDRQIDLANAEFHASSGEGKLADAGQEALRIKTLAAERDRAIDQARQTAKVALIDLEDRHNQLIAAGLQMDKDRLGAERDLLENSRSAAQTDDEKRRTQAALVENTKAQLLIQKKIDDLSTDPNTRAMSGTHYSVGVQSAVSSLDMSDRELSDAARDRRIQFLRAEIQATDDLIDKKRLLIEVQAMEYTAAKRSGDPNVVNAQVNAANAESMDLERQTRMQSADQGLAGLMGGKQPSKGAVQDVLKKYEDLTVFGSPQEAREAIGHYLDVLTLMFEKHWISRQEAKTSLGGVKQDADTYKTADPNTVDQISSTQNTLKPHSVTVGHTEFWEGLAAEASQASSNFLMALLHGKGSKGALKSLLGDVGGMLQNAAAGALQGTLQNAMMSAGSKFAGQLKTGGAGLIKDAAMAGMALSAAINISGANGKKKQTNSLLGLGLGLAVGSLMPGVSLLQGAIGGGFLGGMFAGGGRPPVGKPSIVGERGMELFVPDAPGTIIPNHMLPLAPSMSLGASSSKVGGSGGGLMADVLEAASSAGGDTIQAVQNFHGDIHKDVDMDRASRQFGEQMRRARQNGKR